MYTRKREAFPITNGMNKERIVLIDDDEALSEILINGLKEAGFEVFSAANSEKGIELARSQRPALVVLSSWLRNQHSFGLLKFLKKDFATRAIPVVILAVSGADDEVKKFLELGAVDCIVKPQHTSMEIVERLKNLLLRQDLPRAEETFEEPRSEAGGYFDYLGAKLKALKQRLGITSRAENSEEKHILFIDNDSVTRQIYGDWLVRAGFKVIYAENANEGRETARRLHPEIILLDAQLTKDEVLGDVVDLAKRLKSEKETADIPIIFFTDNDFSPEMETNLKSLGMTDYIHKSISRQEFVKKMNDIRHPQY